MGSFSLAAMMAAQMVLVTLALCLQLTMVQSRARPRPRPRPVFIPFQSESRTIVAPLVDGVHAVEDFVGGLFSPIFGGPQLSADKEKTGLLGLAVQADDGYGAPQYLAPPLPPQPVAYDSPVHIPCEEYRLRRSFIGVLAGEAPEDGVDDCGVFEETNSGYGYHEHCEWVHETIFVTKYKTECSKTYSTQCQTSYKTECSHSHSQECRTEYQEECSYAESEECITVDRPTYNNVCHTTYVEECDGGGYENSYEAPPACSQVPHETCHEEEQSNIETECTRVPKRSCVTSPREVCGEVPKQDCKLVPTSTDCKDIPEKLCRQRAYQYPESTTRQVCGLGESEDHLVRRSGTEEEVEGGDQRVKKARK